MPWFADFWGWRFTCQIQTSEEDIPLCSEAEKGRWGIMLKVTQIIRLCILYGLFTFFNRKGKKFSKQKQGKYDWFGLLLCRLNLVLLFFFNQVLLWHKKNKSTLISSTNYNETLLTVSWSTPFFKIPTLVL